MPHQIRACARVYALGDTLLFAPVFSDRVEEAFDPEGGCQSMSASADPDGIGRALLDALLRYRRIEERFDDLPLVIEESDRALTTQLLTTFGKPSIETTDRELQFVEVVQSGGHVTFTPKQGEGSGLFRARHDRELVLEDESDLSRLAATLFQAFRYAAVELPRTLQRGESALVEMVMKSAPEEVKADASKRWFAFLRTVIKTIDEGDRKQRRGQKETEAD